MPRPPASGTTKTRFRDLVLPYWFSKDSLRSWLMLAFVLSVGFASVYLAMRINALIAGYTDAMIGRNWRTFRLLFLTYSLLMLGQVVLSCLSAALQSRISLDWRTWLTDRILTRWTSENRFYAIERDRSVSNADQRIADDIKNLTEQVLLTFVSAFQVCTSLFSFGWLLWQLSGNLNLSDWGVPVVVPGYMLIACIAVSLLAIAVTHLSGKPLVGLSHRNETVEADFRLLAVQLRENAEQIAFHRGGAAESERLRKRFQRVIQNTSSLIWQRFRLSMTISIYGNLTSPVPTLLALPRYISGAISFGDITQVTGAYNGVSGALAYFQQAYSTFALIAAISRRLCELLDGMDAADGALSSITLKSSDTNESIASSPLSILTPDGRVLVKLPELTFRRGERWMISGPSGTGKSTLLRMLAGLWPHGSGTIILPAADIMFVPQRSYIPTGTLRDALCYPGPSGLFDDEQIRRALEDSLLPGLTGMLNVEDHWQHILSGGEQQRLAFARLLLHRPDFVLLDEASSGLDPQTEQQLYRLLLSHLPTSCLISVAHNESLAAHHTHRLALTSATENLAPHPDLNDWKVRAPQ